MLRPGSFSPVREFGPKSYFDKYENRKDLGNTKKAMDIVIEASGFIQLTGRGNYRHCGDAIGVDLESNPELILDDNVSVQSLLWYLITHGIPVWADRAYNTGDEYDEDFCWRKIQ